MSAENNFERRIKTKKAPKKRNIFLFKDAVPCKVAKQREPKTAISRPCCRTRMTKENERADINKRHLFGDSTANSAKPSKLKLEKKTSFQIVPL